MEQIIKALSAKLNLPESAVRSGIGVILRFMKERAAGTEFEKLLALLPDAAGVMASAPAAGSAGGSSAGGLLGGLLEKAGGLLGGNFGEATETIGALQQAGVPLEKVGPLATGFIDQAKAIAGADVVDGIIEKSPALQAMKDLFKR